MKHIHVAVGVVIQNGEILLSKRHGDQHLAGLWEFPGGKVEAGEPIKDALARELYEELAISITSAETLCEISYDYPEKSVTLHVFTVMEFGGEARGVEGQEVRWVPIMDLANYPLPPANAPIVDQLLNA